MSINVRAAVAWGVNQPMTIESLTYDEPQGRDVLVKMVATGLCHSDLHVLDGSLSKGFPIVLGHEGGGIVAACGPDVVSVKPGDHVIPLFCPECRECTSCTSGKTNICQHFGTTQNAGAKLWLNGKQVERSNGLGTFADYCMPKDFALVKIRDDAPLDKIFYAGCGVTTGVGAVVFTAKVEIGAKVIVFGVGGIGLNVLQGARLANAGMVIAVDTNPDRESISRRFGAMHFVNPKDHGDDVVAHLRQLTGGGADYTFECVGNTKLMRLASDASHPKWGVLTIIGAAPAGQDASVNAFDLLVGRRWQGTMFGGAKGRTDVPRIVDWYMDGKIAIDELITHHLPLERINEGFDLMKNGQSIRTAISFD
jgi:S-(hydroxymethyl)glutathione dehydrogenase/alcohol dehydrogenase